MMVKPGKMINLAESIKSSHRKMIDGERKSDEIMREIMEIVRARREDS